MLRCYDSFIYILLFVFILCSPIPAHGEKYSKTSTTDTTSDLRKTETEIVIYGSPTSFGGLDSSYGFSILDPLKEAWTRFARGYAVDLWKEDASLYLDQDHFLYYGSFDLFNYTFVGGILQVYPQDIYRDNYNVEPSFSSLGMGVVGNGVDGVLVTDSYMILVGFFAYFAANMTSPVINIGACSPQGTNCFQVADGLLDYNGHGKIFYVNDQYYVLYQADTNNTTWRVKHLSNLQATFWNIAYSDQVNMMDAVQVDNNLVIGSIKLVSNSSTNGTRHHNEFMEMEDDVTTQLFNVTLVQINTNGTVQLIYSELWESENTPFLNLLTTTGQDLYVRWSNTLLRWELGNLVPIYSYDGSCDASEISDNYFTSSNFSLFLYCQGAVVQYNIPQNQSHVIQHLEFSECPNFVVNDSRIFLGCDGQLIYYNLQTDFIDSYASNTSKFQFQDIQLCPLVSELVVIGQFDQIGLVDIDKNSEAVDSYQTALWDRETWTYLSPKSVELGYATCTGHYSSVYIASVNSSTSPLMITKLLDEYPPEIFYYYKDTSVRLSLRTPLVIATNGQQAFVALNSFNYTEVILYEPHNNISYSLFQIEGGVIETIVTSTSNNSNTTYVIIGGSFRFVSDRNLTFVNAARFSIDDGSWEYFDSIGSLTGSTGSVMSAVVVNSTVYLSGAFTQVEGNPMLINNIVGCSVDSGQCFDSVQGGVPSSTNITSLIYDGMRTLYFVTFVCGEDTWHRNLDDLTRALMCQNLYAWEIGTLVSPQLFKQSVSVVGANEVGIYMNPKDDNGTKYWILILMSGVCFGAIFCVVIVYVYFYLKRPRYLELTSIDEHDIDFSNEYFELTVELGQGKFGQTWSCELPYHTTKRKFAVKLIMLPLDDPPRIATFEKILSNLQKLRHPHIAPVLAVLRRDVDSQAHYYLFTEFFKAPHSLRGVVMIMNRQFSYDEIKRLILMIVDGLYFLHSRKVPHGSLHTSNVMVHTLVNNPTFIQALQLSDYALLRATEGSHYGSSHHSVAPEARVNVVYDDYKADIWSVGIIIYEILTLQEPPPSETVPDLPEDFAATNLIAVHQKFDVIMKLFYLCTDPDPDKRPTIEELAEMCESL